ncbi:LysR family transcriptional regulator [Roseospira visakhapatnamensis]|uniref:DNA-binding transcriptional LysR family regulator n=1 Tax=Roseospira visakhapatnamensis TaxID=390880 RepID=A0A7W6RDZ7_9PROT|nr:LysR family transcriptional regulator [Roseospira visakhapatnamensis]MBB4266801.1 DNA-binding transcriptional LysR family regulator [Roseospira visakhapatnamensis]
MEMHQVRYFLALADCLNFTRAAEICNVSQPALTKAIRKLEEELGGQLFRRERTLTHLTDLGLLMKPHLEAVMAASSAARVEARSFQRLEKAPLTLGVMCTIGPRRLIGFFQSLEQEIPTIEVSLREGPGDYILDHMLQGALDLALLALPRYPERLDVRALYGERYVVGFGARHRFADLDQVPLRALDGEDYLNRANCEYPEYMAALHPETEDLALRVRYESEREDWIQAMILAGMGCAVMPEFLPIMPGIHTRPLVEPSVRRTISLVSVAGRRFSPPVRAVVALAERFDWTNAGD